MKAILVVAMMIQYQVEAGQMFQIKRYSATGCSSAQTELDHIEVASCTNYGDATNTFFAGIVCNAQGHATVTKYSDSSCQNVDTSFSVYGYVSGVHNHGGACVNSSSSATDIRYESHMCVTVDTVSITRYTDASCTTAAPSGLATAKAIINTCEFDTDDGTVKAGMSATVANGSVQYTEYNGNTCTGAGTVVSTVDPNTCTYDGEKSLYFKWDGAVTSAGASASTNTTNTTAATTASTSKTTLQRGFLACPFFMGVAAFLL